MKYLLFALITITTLSMSAQKYTKKDANNVTKEFNGTMFSGAKTIAENVAGSNSFTFVNRVFSNQTLIKEINQEEMVTIFVMTDKVFNDMDEEQLEAFMAANDYLSAMVKSHSVPGRLDALSIKKAIEANGGAASFLTLAGTKLIATMKGDDIILKDVEGNQATIIDTNFYHKNGFFHIIEGMAFSSVIEE